MWCFYDWNIVFGVFVEYFEFDVVVFGFKFLFIMLGGVIKIKGNNNIVKYLKWWWWWWCIDDDVLILNDW